MLSTTLSNLKAANACQPRYKHLYKSLGGVKNYGKDTPVTYLQILEICGIDDCLWALFHGEDAAILLGRLWTLDCAERVQQYSEAAQQLNAVTRKFLTGQATVEELSAAWAAWDAAWDAGAAARSAAWAAGAAAGAATWNAARSAAGAAWDAAWDAAGGGDAGAAAWDAAWDAEKEWQIQHLREMLENS